MPFAQLISLLLLPALAAWLFAILFIYLIFNPIRKKNILGFSIQGILPANKQRIIVFLTNNILKVFTNEDVLQKSLLNSDAINKLKPEIEMHVDIFLREKLKESFPMMHQLMGEKTLARFKEVFLNEVEALLPIIIQKHATGLLNNKTINGLILSKLNSIEISELASLFKKAAARHLFYLKLFAVIVGLIVGIFQIFIVLLLNQNAL